MAIKNFFRFIFLLTLSLMATACFSLSDDAAVEVPTAVLGTDSAEPLTGTAFAACSLDCAARAQCGEAPDLENSRFILANSGQPHVENHDLVIQEGVEVQILASVSSAVQRRSDPSQQYMLRFYQIAAPDGAGWVAGWCIQQ